jgi:hypothetical protein
MEDSEQNIGYLALGSSASGLASPSQSIATRVLNTLKSFALNGIASAQASLIDINTDAGSLYDLRGDWTADGASAGLGLKGGYGAGWTAGDIFQSHSHNSGFMIGFNVGAGLGPPLSGGAATGFDISSNHEAENGFLDSQYYVNAGILKAIDAAMWPVLNQFGLSVKEGNSGETAPTGSKC